MSRTLGTVVRGVRAPIFREGDSVVDITVSTVLNALAENNITARDGDVVAVTESVVARCQGNYATCEQIAEDVRARTGGKTVGVAFPILSRNRFAVCLRGIAKGAKKIVLMLSYPSDEVGNHLVSMDQLDEAGIDPWHDVLSLQQFRDAFGEVIHPFTGVDYVTYYKSIIEDAGAEAEIVFANRVQAVLDYTDTVICCDIHTRQRSKRLLTAAGAKVVLGLPTPELQAEAAQIIADNQLNVRQAEALCKKLAKPAKEPVAAPLPSALPVEVEESLKQALGSEVRVAYHDGKGKLTVHFYSDDQLKAFANLLGQYSAE